MFNKEDNYMEKKIINYLLENRKGTLNEISEETNIEQKKETYEGSPLLDYEKLKRWARWIVGREVFDKIIFGITDTSDRLHNWFDSSWNKIEQLKKHTERRDLAAGIYYIRKNGKIIKHYSWKSGQKFPEIRFLLYSELFKYVKMGLVYTIEKDYYNKHCRKGWETDAKNFTLLTLKHL